MTGRENRTVTLLYWPVAFCERSRLRCRTNDADADADAKGLLPARHRSLGVYSL